MNKSKTLVLGASILLLMLSGYIVGAAAHEEEPFVDWEVAYSYIEWLGPPEYTYQGRKIVAVPDPVSRIDPHITMNTGDILYARYRFRFLGEDPIKADAFYLTRLGLDFGILGKYVNGKFIGGSYFRAEPGQTYEVLLVLRAITPTKGVTRHLHVGISLEGIGNIPVAEPMMVHLPGERYHPRLYGLFVDIIGEKQSEPLAGLNLRPVGEVKVVEDWFWTPGSIYANIGIAAAFMAVMYFAGKRRG
ncbi:MAG: hypothetical protein NZ988_04920 [Thaumarchaeota archaeon]|nr:hypothetical protein [Candidatus Calditenuaceae archaeon]MDW8187368.1 hypothetical protein [Nitrososphaerota archaeon]